MRMEEGTQTMTRDTDNQERPRKKVMTISELANGRKVLWKEIKEHTKEKERSIKRNRSVKRRKRE